MAKTETKKKAIFQKVIGTPSGRFKGELVKISPQFFELVVTSLIDETVTVEVIENESYAERVEKLRPIPDEGKSLTAAKKKANQAKIDSYLEKNTIAEALKEVDDKGTRAIEKELGFMVERWIDEKMKVREVPVQKEAVETKTKKVKAIPFYFRPSGSMVSKTLYNFVKHENSK